MKGKWSGHSCLIIRLFIMLVDFGRGLKAIFSSLFFSFKLQQICFFFLLELYRERINLSCFKNIGFIIMLPWLESDWCFYKVFWYGWMCRLSHATVNLSWWILIGRIVRWKKEIFNHQITSQAYKIKKNITI